MIGTKANLSTLQPAASPDTAWGQPPSARYQDIAARLRPLLARIRQGSVDRELNRTLPVSEIAALKQAGFTALRVPEAFGGLGLSLPEFTALLIELAEADSNIAQALRAHFGFVEYVLTAADPVHRATWLRRIAAGEIVGAAATEGGNAGREAFTTTLRPEGGGWRLDGSKFYTTGSLFAEWIMVTATAPDDTTVKIMVRRESAGVEVIDDWDGMGQRLTASGTAHFRAVPVEEAEIVPADRFLVYSQAWFQLIHIATVAGIGRAAAIDLARLVRARKRTFSHATAGRPAQDPQILEIVGKVHAAAYAAGVIAIDAARAIQRVQDVHDDEALREKAAALAEIETWQAQSIVLPLIIEATGIVFDALGASSTLRGNGLDRYWRNARTLASHNPRTYRERIVGDWAVNGTPPPAQWRVGVA